MWNAITGLIGMKNGRRLVPYAFALAASQTVLASDTPITFSPRPGVTATLSVHGARVDLETTGRQGKRTETIEIETEKPIRIEVEDYDFDGHKDFSISHTDDGMGTYERFQVRVFSPATGRFTLLAPKCGDDFINLRMLKKERALVNAYVEKSVFKICEMRF